MSNENVIPSSTGVKLPRASRPERIVRKAEERFAAAGGRAISLEDLCTAAGVRKSSLYDAFHRVCGTSPLSYFHRCRLSRARLILLETAPQRGQIKRAALQVGLTELGRFSVEYRKLFGESPSATLARSGADGESSSRPSPRAATKSPPSSRWPFPLSNPEEPHHRGVDTQQHLR